MVALSRAAFFRTSANLSRGIKRINAVGTGALRFPGGQATTWATCRNFSATADEAFTANVARDMCEVDNETLVELSLEGSVEASEERLIRDIMSVDEVEWDAAKATFDTIDATNNSGMVLQTMPYKVSVAAVVLFGFATFPLCFDLTTAKWFNEAYVTTDVPGVEDLETTLEIGSWTWNWMEPPLGQLSFFLLCLQYSRAQMEKVGSKPFTASLMKRRANKLSTQFPTYNAGVVEDFSLNKGLF